MEIKNNTAIVTGGASGMGKATAYALAKKGARVVILDRDLSSANLVAKELNGLAIQCNVTEEESVQAALEKIISALGAPRILINCAGIIHSKRMVGKEGPLPLSEFRQVIEINLIGTFNLMRLTSAVMMSLAPLGESSERGVIINTASIAAFEGQIGQTAYSASKGGVIGLMLPAARELASFGIRVMTIAPGLVDTPMFAKIPPEAKSALAANVPFPKRLAHPEEFAKLVLHIIDNEMLNGEVIRLDGALRMQPK